MHINLNVDFIEYRLYSLHVYLFSHHRIYEFSKILTTIIPVEFIRNLHST